MTARQHGGVLRIETVRGDTAVAAILDGSGAEDLVVLPSALRIVSRPTASASYRIRVPARALMFVGETPPGTYRPGEGSREIDLDTGDPSEAEPADHTRRGNGFWRLQRRRSETCGG